jgi:DNA-binding MarR family transcriptional regulator
MTMTAADLDRVGGELSASMGRLVRRLRQVHVDGDLTLSQASVLFCLERDGPATPGTLATLEQITPQSMGAILVALEETGLVSRSGDPSDGRRVLMSITNAGRESLQGVRHEKARRLGRAIATGFDPAEQRRLAEAIPLLERLGRLV